MRYSFLLAIIIFIQYQVDAQGSRSFRAKSGEDLAQIYSPQGFYRFPQFSKAVLYFKNGNKNTGPLFNYNVLSGTMQFIGPAHDTLDLGNPDIVDSVVFENTVFIYRDGFLEVVDGNDSFQLLKKLTIKVQVENIGAYGLANSTASITNMKSYSTGTSVYSLVLNQDVVLAETTQWFFAGSGNFIKANKSNLLKLLPPDKSIKAETYLKQNKTNFEKENDLKKLMAAIAG